MNTTAPEVRAAARRELARRELARRHLADWCEYGPATQRGPMRLRRWQRHFAATVEAMARVILDDPNQAEKIHIWLFSAPTQEGKTELMRRAIAWLAAQGLTCAQITYAISLATEHNRAIRDLLRSDHAHAVWPHLAPPKDKAKVRKDDAPKDTEIDFTVPHPDGIRRSAHVMAFGRDGALSGRTTDIIWLDDMFKLGTDYASAASRRELDSLLSTSVFPRLMQNGGHLLVGASRWGEFDAHGWIENKVAELRAEGVDVVVHDTQYPLRARKDSPDGRAEGEYISDKWTLSKERGARILYGRHAAAILDCQPAPDTGEVWRREYFSQRYSGTPEAMAALCDFRGLSVDGAATGGGGDHTVIQHWGWIGARSYLLGQWRGQWDYPTLRETLKDTIASVRPHGVAVENASSGRQVTQELVASTRGIELVTVRGSKRLRWEAVHPQHRSGQVFYPEAQHAPWMGLRTDRLLRLTGEVEGEVDDEADAEALALTWRAARLSERRPARSGTALRALDRALG